nr:hypothetical protein Iba_chr08eCG4000 [Ipomoea batatas]
MFLLCNLRAAHTVGLIRIDKVVRAKDTGGSVIFSLPIPGFSQYAAVRAGYLDVAGQKSSRSLPCSMGWLLFFGRTVMVKKPKALTPKNIPALPPMFARHLAFQRGLDGRLQSPQHPTGEVKWYPMGFYTFVLQCPPFTMMELGFGFSEDESQRGWLINKLGRRFGESSVAQERVPVV